MANIASPSLSAWWQIACPARFQGYLWAMERLWIWTFWWTGNQKHSGSLYLPFNTVALAVYIRCYEHCRRCNPLRNIQIVQNREYIVILSPGMRVIRWSFILVIFVLNRPILFLELRKNLRLGKPLLWFHRMSWFLYSPSMIHRRMQNQ